MAGLTYVVMYPDLDKAKIVIEDFLDKPAAEFLGDKTIEQILLRAYNTVFFQTTIDTDNQTQVTDVINAITVWQVFGAYMNSMSDNLQDTNKFEFMNKLKHYRDIARGLGNLLGIDITGERVMIDSTQIIVGGTGISNFEDYTAYEGAHDNVV